MRRINSEFQTLHISEEGQKLSNRDYFGYVGGSQTSIS